jgi:hypothetical protein
MNPSDRDQKWKPEAQSIPVPDSAPPTFLDLTNEVQRRRRRRTVTKAAVLAVVTACVVLVVTHQPSDAIIDGQAMQVQDVQSDLAESPVTVIAEAPKDENKPATMRLFARVRGDSPVFEFDRETKQMHHVGWVQSLQRVPIDMRYVPSHQQETYEAVLYSKAVPFSL